MQTGWRLDLICIIDIVYKAPFSGFSMRGRDGEGESLHNTVSAPGVAVRESANDSGERHGDVSGAGSEAVDLPELRQGLFRA